MWLWLGTQIKTRRWTRFRQEAFVRHILGYDQRVQDGLSGRYPRCWHTGDAIINVPSQQTTWLATSIRNGIGPMVNVHPTLAAAVGAGNTHRTSFACAEMDAVNGVLQSLRSIPEDAGAMIFGTSDGQDPGPEVLAEQSYLRI